MALINYAFGTSTAFKAAVKQDNTLYFLSDTHELYKGSVQISTGEAISTFNGTKPTSVVNGRLYVDLANGALYKAEAGVLAKIVDGAGALAVGDTTQVEGFATVTDVAAFVAQEIAKNNTAADVKSVTYDKAGKQLVVTDGAGTAHKTVLENLGATLAYSAGKLELKDPAGTSISEVTLELERVLEDAYYDADTKDLVFQIKVEGSEAPEEVRVPAADFVALYTAVDTNTVNMTVENTAEGNVIKADVKLSAEAENQISAKADGLHVGHDTTKIDKASIATSVGTVEAGSDEKVVSQKAAATAVKTLQDSIDSLTGVQDDYVKKESISTSIGAVDASSDEKVASEKAVAAVKVIADKGVADAATAKAAADAAQATADAAVPKADITTTLNADAASDTKVVSESAVVNALTWKTI